MLFSGVIVFEKATGALVFSRRFENGFGVDIEDPVVLALQVYAFQMFSGENLRDLGGRVGIRTVGAAATKVLVCISSNIALRDALLDRCVSQGPWGGPNGGAQEEGSWDSSQKKKFGVFLKRTIADLCEEALDSFFSALQRRSQGSLEWMGFVYLSARGERELFRSADKIVGARKKGATVMGGAVGRVVLGEGKAGAGASPKNQELEILPGGATAGAGADGGGKSGRGQSSSRPLLWRAPGGETRRTGIVPGCMSICRAGKRPPESALVPNKILSAEFSDTEVAAMFRAQRLLVAGEEVLSRIPNLAGVGLLALLKQIATVCCLFGSEFVNGRVGGCHFKRCGGGLVILANVGVVSEGGLFMGEEGSTVSAEGRGPPSEEQEGGDSIGTGRVVLVPDTVLSEFFPEKGVLAA